MNPSVDSRRWRRALTAAMLSAVLAACGARSNGGANDIAPPPHLVPVMALAGAGALDAQVLTLANGVGHAAWIQPASTGGPAVIHTSHLVNGVWGTPRALPATSAELGDASTPRLALHPDGEATLVWLQSVRGVHRLFHSHTVEGTWRAPEPLRHARLDADARHLQLVADGHGNALVVWSESTVGDAEVRSVWVSRSAGGSFGTPEKLNPGDELVDTPRIYVTGNGSALAVWNRYDGRHRTLAASSYWNGSWSPSQLVDSTTSDGMWGELWDLMVARNF